MGGEARKVRARGASEARAGEWRQGHEQAKGDMGKSRQREARASMARAGKVGGS